MYFYNKQNSENNKLYAKAEQIASYMLDRREEELENRVYRLNRRAGKLSSWSNENFKSMQEPEITTELYEFFQEEMNG